MPTKPNAVTDLPPPFGGAGNYLAGVYGPTLPWGDSNPLAGQPLPWGGQPRLNSTGLTSWANTGFTPQIPTDASPFNEYMRRVAIWQTDWVALGTNAADADAHIMETTAAGLSRAVAYEATAGFQGAASTQATLIKGFTVPSGETSAFGANTTVTMSTDTAFTGTSTTVASVGSVVFLSGGGALGATALGVNAGGELFFGLSDRVHFSPQGYVYATGDQESATALQATNIFATTTQSVTGVGAGNVKVIVEGWGQRSTTGDVEIDVQEDQGSATWIDIGSPQTIDWVNDDDANIWSYFRHERTINIGTSTATFFRAQVAGNGGSTAKVRESNLRVVPERF